MKTKYINFGLCIGLICSSAAFSAELSEGAYITTIAQLRGKGSYTSAIDAAIKFIKDKANAFPRSDILSEAAVELAGLAQQLKQEPIDVASAKDIWDRMQKNRTKIEAETFLLPGNRAAKEVYVSLMPLYVITKRHHEANRNIKNI